MTARSRYDGFPQVFLSGDKEKALAHLGRAKSLLSEVQNLREVAGVPVFQRSIQQEGVSITVKSAVDTDVIYVHAYEDVRLLEKKDGAYTYPAVLSGYIRPRTVTPESPDTDFVSFKEQQKITRVTAEAAAEGREPTEAELALTAEERESARQPTGWFAPTHSTVRVFGELLDRPSINPHKTDVLCADAGGVVSAFKAFDPRTGDYERIYKYGHGRWFTGALAKCAQVVLGIHASAIDALQKEPEFLQEDAGRAERYAQAGKLMASDEFVRLVQQCRGFIPNYAATWAQSDGLVRGFDGWWLVRITPSRVLARRLPVFYGSDEPEFAEHYRKLGLESLADFIDEMGGLPTGEGFGTNRFIEAGIEAGYIFDITPGGMPFRNCTAPYEYCTWSFSDMGEEAHNTGIFYNPGEDLNYFRWASLRFKPVNIGGVFRIEASVIEHAFEPLFISQFRVEGVMLQCIPNFKVPYGFANQVENLSLWTNDGRMNAERDKTYNTVVWVGYVDGGLHTIRYYRNPNQQSVATYSGEPPPKDCPFSGSWEWAVDYGVAPQPATMLSNAWDTRETLSAGGERWKMDSQKITEYITGGHFIDAPDWSFYTPQAVFREKHQNWKMGGDAYSAYITVYPERGAYTCASSLATSVRESYSVSYKYEQLGGPWTGYGWRCFPRINWRSVGCLIPGLSLEQHCKQTCNWMPGAPPNDTIDRFICFERTEIPGCWGLVDILPPARCTDMTSFLGNSVPMPTLPAPSGTAAPDKKMKYLGRCFNTTAGGYEYKPNPLAFEIDLPSISPHPVTGFYQSISSTRNNVGYGYACFSLNLSGTMGVAKVGDLHNGDQSLRTDLTFVGVPD